MAAALVLWFWQEVQYFGTAAEAFRQHDPGCHQPRQRQR